MGRIVAGLALIVVGGVAIYFHNQLYKMFGDIAWAERTLGESKIVYVLLGCGLVILGVLLLFGIGPSDPTDTGGMQFGG